MPRITAFQSTMVLLMLSSARALEPIPVAVRRAAEGIRAADLEREVRFLASDALLGRATPSFGLDRAGGYIAASLASAGIRPYGDHGTFYQALRFDVRAIDASCSSAEFGGAHFGMPADVRIPVTGARDTGSIAGSGRLVYVQHGWVSKALDIDPYAGVDLQGKIAVTTAYPGGGKQLADDQKRAGDFVAPWRAAAEHGAIAQIEIAGPATWDASERPMPRLRDSLAASAAILAAPWFVSYAASPIPRISASRHLADALFADQPHTTADLLSPAGATRPVGSFELDAKRQLQFSLCTRSGAARTRNVVAVIEGGDPVLKREYVVIGAHYDGQGLQLPPVDGDSIMNSAEDNASGTAGLLDVARAFARGPRPKRSVVFVWFAGEEMSIGSHLGSQFFVANPPVPLATIKAMINLDEIGIVRTDKTGVIGLGFTSTALRDLAVATNESYLKIGLRPSADGHLGGGSDYHAFGQRRIPYLSYESDGGEDHSLTDEAQYIDYAALARMTRTVYVTAWRLANEQHVEFK